MTDGGNRHTLQTVCWRLLFLICKKKQTKQLYRKTLIIGLLHQHTHPQSAKMETLPRIEPALKNNYHPKSIIWFMCNINILIRSGLCVRLVMCRIVYSFQFLLQGGSYNFNVVFIMLPPLFRNVIKVPKESPKRVKTNRRIIRQNEKTKKEFNFFLLKAEK